MEETLISYETAKLAKEKGYIGRIGLGYKYNTGHYYNDVGELDGDCTNHLRNVIRNKGKDIENPNISAPTQSLLQKWLRDIHNIEVFSKSEYKNLVKIGFYYGGDVKYSQPIYKTYEEALEKGLQKALNLI
mgnify:FL=1|jgi:hypothetical protein